MITDKWVKGLIDCIYNHNTRIVEFGKEMSYGAGINVADALSELLTLRQQNKDLIEDASNLYVLAMVKDSGKLSDVQLEVLWAHKDLMEKIGKEE